MKKVLLLALVIVLVSTLVATPVLAESKAKGAVKADLIAPDGEVCGWVIANTNGNGYLNIQVHMNAPSEAAGETGDVMLHHPPLETIPLGEITLNVQGNGSAHFQAGPLPPPDVVPILHFYLEVGPCLTGEMAVPQK
jgi:hypothetical protein